MFAITNALLRPRVYYAKGAREDLDLIRDKDYHHVYAFNHLSDWDLGVLRSIIYQIAPYDVGNTRELMNSYVFEELIARPFLWHVTGAIPVFITPYYKYSKKHKKFPERLATIPKATEKLFDCTTYIQTQRRQKIVICPEGGYNHGPPDTLLPIRRGVGEIAHRVAQIDGPVAITTIGFAYSKKAQRLHNPWGTSAYVERTIFVKAGMTPEQIIELTRIHLLSSVQNAVALY
jgi:hypothetical protein